MNFSFKEIIDLAVAIEQAGYEFYRSCSEKFDDGHIAELFRFLANEEEQHKKSFESLRGKS